MNTNRVFLPLISRWPGAIAALALFLPSSWAQTGPSITTQPSSQTNLAGANATLSVAVAGTGPFIYRWQLNRTDLPNLITTVAGGGANDPGDGGAATNASLYLPAGMAVDASGNLFVADSRTNCRVWKVDANGSITAVAGHGSSGFSGDGGAATNASLNFASGVAVDDSGNLFIADRGNLRIRKVAANGVITTVAGNGSHAYSGDGGAATNASLFDPTGVAADASGNLFIAGGDRIRKVDAKGIITTVAGNGSHAYSGDGGAATNAGLIVALGVAVDASGDLFIADSTNSRVRKVDVNGIITAVAGNGSHGYSGDGGAATNALLNFPVGAAADVFGNLFIADAFNYRVRKVDDKGVITTVAGHGSSGYSGDGGAAIDASLNSPAGAAVDTLGNLFIVDRGNNRIRKVALAGLPTLSLNNVSASTAGDYQVIIASPYGSVTSVVATLTVRVPPSIVAQPASFAVALGGTAVFSVAALGTQPLSYAWYFNGANLVQAGTNSTLSLANASLTVEGEYTAVITNLFGSVTSRVATLSVGHPPTIANEPTNQTALFGGTAALNVAVSGAGPFTYQWQLNGTDLPSLITTVAGNGSSGYSGDGGAATNASLNQPSGVAVDASGILFIADLNNNRIRKVDATGVITTVAGNGAFAYSGDGGAAANASLKFPFGVAVDASGNLFVADFGNDSIRKVDGAGVITTVAGNGRQGYSGDGGAATSASLSEPVGAAVDASGNLFIADTYNSRVRKVDANGIITTVAGGGTNYPGDGGEATNAAFSPSGVAGDASGNLFIADGNGRIRKVDVHGVITTVAGNGTPGYSGDGGAATNASLNLNSPAGVAVDASGNLFIADANNQVIRKVDVNGIITTVAGGGTNFPGDGGAATNASLGSPLGAAVDASGNLFIADSGNIRKVALAGIPTLILANVSALTAGDYRVIITSPYGSVTSAVATLTVLSPPSIVTQPASFAAAVGSTAAFSVAAMGTQPLSYAWYLNGSKLVQLGTNSTLSLVTASPMMEGNYTVVITNLFGSVTSGVATLSVGYAPTIANEPVNQTALFGSNVTLNVAAAGDGPFTYQWQLNGTNFPNEINIITTVAGGGTNAPGDGGAATNAFLQYPRGVAVDTSGNLFIADSGNQVIRKVDVKGIITTVAGNGYINLGNGTGGYSGDGGAASNASLNEPSGMAVDASGNLFIADSNNNRIRKVDSNGIITTTAGNGIVTTNQDGVVFGTYSGDKGPATNASLNYPSGTAVDASGNLFIADSGNGRIRKVDTNGIITTVAGGGTNAPGDGGAATNASLGNPTGAVVDASGNLFIADGGFIRKVDINGIITTMAGGGTNDPGDGGAATNASLSAWSVAVDAFGNLLIADSGNFRIRKVDANGVITTVAGNGPAGYAFIPDLYNFRIRKVDAKGVYGIWYGSFSGDGGAATNASLNYPDGVAVDASGNLFIADTVNMRIRKAALGDFPKLTLANVSAGNAGNYQVVIASPYGSATSMVASLTVLLPPSSQIPGMVMGVPFLSGDNLLLGFSLSQTSSASVTVLRAPSITGPWTTNTAAALTRNSQTGGYQFSVPTPNAVEFYQLRSP